MMYHEVALRGAILPSCEKWKRVATSLLQAEAEMLRNAQKRTAVEWEYETDMSERNEEQKRKYEVRRMTQ